MLLLQQEGIVSLKVAKFTDGTKIESAANKYTFVWGRSIKANKDRMKAQLDELCSKTDPDATFMRMKEDHMLNGQLKPAYNLQISTQDQFILNYSLHQTTTDSQTLPLHIEQYESLYDELPKAIIADAGYGSDDNYE